MFGFFLGGRFIAAQSYVLKPVTINSKLKGTSAEFLNTAHAVKFGNFLIYHTDTNPESLTILTEENKYPVFFIKKDLENKVELSICDKQQHVIKHSFNNEVFNNFSFVK